MISSSAATRVATGAAWLLLVQVATSIVQLGYAAFSSRLVGEAQFGQYGVALSATALVGLIANSGLGLSASRMTSDSEDEVRAVITVALLMGLAAATVLFFGANPWAALWGDRGAAPAIRVLSLGLLVTPAVSVQMGLMRRNGKFARLAVGSFVTSVTGMLIGAWCIFQSATATALVASSVSATWLLYLFGIMTFRRAVMPSLRLRSSWPHVSFGLKALVGSLMNFAAATTPSFAISRILGTAALGQWNRATVLGVLPIEMVTNSLARAVYPEAKSSSTGNAVEVRNRQIWTAAVVLPSLAVWPGVGLLVPILPSLVTTILGPKWSLAGEMSQFLAAGAAVMLTLTVLSAVQESNGHFQIFWVGTASLLSIAGVGAFGVFHQQNWLPGALAAVIGPLLALALQVSLSVRQRLMDAIFVVRSLSQTLAIALGFALLCTVLLRAVHGIPGLLCGVMFLVAIEYTIVLRLPQSEPLRAPVLRMLRGIWGGRLGYNSVSSYE